MKHLLSFLLALSITSLSFAQLQSVSLKITDDMPKYSAQNPYAKNKSATNPKSCTEDTIEYARYKGTGFQGIGISTGYALGQYYDAPDTVEVGGVTFYGWTISSNNDSVTLTINLYKAGTDTLPIGSPLRTATIKVDTAFGGGVLSSIRKSVQFATPLKTIDPFIVTIESSDSIRVGIVANSYNNGDGEGENIACGTVGGTWYRCLNLNIGGTTLDCDMLLEPHIAYQSYAGFSAPTCFDWSDTVRYTNQSSPILSHRMYNRYITYNLGRYSFYWYYGNGAGSEYTTTPKKKFPTYNNYQTRLVTTMYTYRSPIGCRDTAYQDLYYQPSNVGIVADTPVCSGNIVTIDAFSTAPINWYNNYSDTTPFNTGNKYTTSTLDSSVTYYLQAENKECLSPRTAFTIPVAISPDDPVAINDSICLNAKANVSASSNVGNITWWDAATGGNHLGSGDVFVSNPLTSSVTYYAEANNKGCKSKNRAAAYVDVKASNSPADPVTNVDSLICLYDGTATLSATSPSGTDLYWYELPAGGSAVASGNTYSYSPQSLGADYIYVEAHDGQCASSRVQKKLIVWTFQTVTVANSDTLCLGDTLEQDYSYTFGKLRWYDQATGGNVVYDSNKFKIFDLTSSTTFYLEPYSEACIDTLRHELNIEIIPFGILSEIMGDNICANHTATVSAKTDAGTILWSTANDPNTVIGTGETYTTEELTGNTSYLVKTKNYNCVSTSFPVDVQVKPAPSAAYNYQVNSAGNFTFLAATSGLTYHWDFGDGETANTRQATHQYVRNGEFDVVLTTTGSNNCSSDRTRLIKVAGLVTSVDEVNHFRMTIYPNPAQSFINIDASEASKLKVFNTLGQIVERKSLVSGLNTVNLNVPTGTYYLEISYKDKKYRKQILIQ
jgi:hypothetical protein